MIRHVALFKFKPSFTPALEQRWLAGLGTLVGAVPGLRELTIGKDVLGSDRSYDYAIVADFDHIAQLAGYAAHPLHLPLIALSGPNSEHIVSVDFEIPAPPTAEETS